MLPARNSPSPPHNGIQFFGFRVCFCQKVPGLELGSPTGNPGSATAVTKPVVDPGFPVGGVRPLEGAWTSDAGASW